MILPDEESVITLSPSHRESLLDIEQLSHAQQIPVIPNHTASARGSHRHSDGEQKNAKKAPPKPRLLHPILHRAPLHFRFGLNGFLGNVLFMVCYNAAVVQYEHTVSSSTIYAVVYLLFIPVNHAIISLLVFGWPERYIRSLMSNAPVGLTAIVLGAALTEYLDKIEFNGWVAEAVTEYWKMLGYNNSNNNNTGDAAIDGRAATPSPLKNEQSRGNGEFYSSLFVLIITGIWNFVLSVMVNAPAESLEKKEV